MFLLTEVTPGTLFILTGGENNLGNAIYFTFNNWFAKPNLSRKYILFKEI